MIWDVECGICDVMRDLRCDAGFVRLCWMFSPTKNALRRLIVAVDESATSNVPGRKT